MAVILGFSAGVMIFVSFVKLLPHGTESIGLVPGSLAFLAGMAIMFVVDILVPHEYMAERHGVEEGHQQRVLKTGLLVALGLGIHNLPEGMATFSGTLQDIELGSAIALAIAIHNIPEGLAVAAPIYAATGSRWKAFLWSMIPGLAEPMGALLAAALLLPFTDAALLGWLLSGVAGIMVFVALDELLPVSHSFGEEHFSILGIGVGMAVMAASLWMLG